MFYKPDYNGNSIVNLMSSISECFGVKSVYMPLKLLNSKCLKDYSNIINIVIDGLGYNYLQEKGTDFLKKNTLGKITSVFPTTTAACITSFATGLAPKEHGVTGWFVRLKGKGEYVPAVLLPFSDRRNGESLLERRIHPEDVFIDSRLSRKIRNLKIVLPEVLNNTVYTNYILESADKLTYKGLDDFFESIALTTINDKNDQSYIYGYLPDLDAMIHKTGSTSPELSDLFYSISEKIEGLVNKIKGTNSIIIITADHGLVDGDVKKRININEFPEIHNMLDFPLCGEPRAAYCYVKERYKKDFIRIVSDRIGFAVEVLTKEQMMREDYFGLFSPHPDLSNRIGDFVLVCKENYVIKDFLDNEDVDFHLADHGGLSSDEMFVPLIVIET